MRSLCGALAWGATGAWQNMNALLGAWTAKFGSRSNFDMPDPAKGMLRRRSFARAVILDRSRTLNVEMTK